MEKQDFWRIFRETGQEAVRLQAALQGFFSEAEHFSEVEHFSEDEHFSEVEHFSEAEQECHREEYGQYLKRRIRPAVEALIRTGEIEKIAFLERQGWFQGRELDDFIRIAVKSESYAVLMWLQRLKREKYGYRDRDFSL